MDPPESRQGYGTKHCDKRGTLGRLYSASLDTVTLQAATFKRLSTGIVPAMAKLGPIIVRQVFVVGKN